MPAGLLAGRWKRPNCASSSSSSTRRWCAFPPARRPSSAARRLTSCASSASTAPPSPRRGLRTRRTRRASRPTRRLRTAAGRLCQGKRRGDRSRRLRSAGDVAGEEGHLVVDLRQRAPRQPPVTPSCSRPTAFADLDFAGCSCVESPDALIERLDNGACQGCHQSGSTAGFHFIGLDDDSSSPLNRIEVGRVAAFPCRAGAARALICQAVMEDREPQQFRPLSLAPPADWANASPAYEPAERCHAVFRR